MKMLSLVIASLISVSAFADQEKDLVKLTSILTNETHYQIPEIGQNNSANEVYTTVSVNEMDNEKMLVRHINHRVSKLTTRENETLGDSFVSWSNVEISLGQAHAESNLRHLLSALKPAHQRTVKNLLSYRGEDFLRWQILRVAVYNVEAELTAQEDYLLVVDMPGSEKKRVFEINLNYGHN